MHAGQFDFNQLRHIAPPLVDSVDSEFLLDGRLDLESADGSGAIATLSFAVERDKPRLRTALADTNQRFPGPGMVPD